MMKVGEEQTGADTTYQARNSKGCGPLFFATSRRSTKWQTKNANEENSMTKE